MSSINYERIAPDRGRITILGCSSGDRATASHSAALRSWHTSMWARGPVQTELGTSKMRLDARVNADVFKHLRARALRPDEFQQRQCG